MSPKVKWGQVRDDPELRDREYCLADREEAGRRLALLLAPHRGSDALVLAIPAGGVPVAAAIAQSLELPLDLLLVRKVQIPWNPEAGFGAVGPDGKAIFNESLRVYLNLSQAQVEAQVAATRKVLAAREAKFRGGRPYPEMTGRTLVIVDDGLASGYTMLAALDFVRRRRPGKIVVAVPTALMTTIERIFPQADEVVCLNVRHRTPFAVAAAYRNWYDLDDEEVLEILAKVADTHG